MNSNKKIQLSVLMSVHNGEKFISTAINSVLEQTFNNFEFIIIDDGSTDRSLEIIRSFRDKRIKVLINRVNLGLTKSLNKGIKIAKGKYIARMDADDICDKSRFALQINYLQKNPHVGILGTDINNIYENDKGKPPFQILKYKSFKKFIKLFFNSQKPKSHNVCVWYLLFQNCFYHPTVMFDKKIINSVGGYQTERSEDLDLWTRLFDKTTFANLKIPLLSRRVHSAQSSTERISKEFDVRIIARQRVFSFIFGKETSLNFIKLLSVRRSIHKHEYKVILDSLNLVYSNFNKKYSLTLLDQKEVLFDYLRTAFLILKKISLIHTFYFVNKTIKILMDIIMYKIKCVILRKK